MKQPTLAEEIRLLVSTWSTEDRECVQMLKVPGAATILVNAERIAAALDLADATADPNPYNHAEISAALEKYRDTLPTPVEEDASNG